jgi:hypothetical protein
MKEILLKEVVYKDYNRNNASVIKNMLYKTDENHNSYFDLYVPSDKKTDSKLPAVILIHGEAKSVSSMKDIGQYHSWGRSLLGSHGALHQRWHAGSRLRPGRHRRHPPGAG